MWHSLEALGRPCTVSADDSFHRGWPEIILGLFNSLCGDFILLNQLLMTKACSEREGVGNNVGKSHTEQRTCMTRT